MSRRGVRGFNARALIDARRASGLSLGDLARLADVSDAAIHHWETGHAAPQVDSLRRVTSALGLAIADVLDLSVDECSLVDLRSMAGVTQSEAAEQLGITAAALSKLERAQTRLTEGRADQLASLYGVAARHVADGWERARQRPAGALP